MIATLTNVTLPWAPLAFLALPIAVALLVETLAAKHENREWFK